jgi:predicted homoserine dehydrogenase-like protein
MWIVDTALKEREQLGNHIRVGIVGAGFMGQGLTNQIVHSTPGMRVVAISNRQVDRAANVFHYAGLEDVAVAESQQRFDDAICASKPVVTEDAMLLARSQNIDVLVDVTGSVDSVPGSARRSHGKRHRIDERRARRDDRAHSSDLCQSARRHLDGLQT